MKNIKLIAFMGFIFVLALGLTVIYLQKQQANKYFSGETVNLPTKVQATNEDLYATSPDGKKTLTMKKSVNDGQTTYSFYSDNELVITKTTAGKITIPHNTWSTDDKHFFLKEEVSGQVNFFSEPGDINITSKFYEKFPNYTLQDVTGWADNTLLVVNANDGKNNISYWFDLSTQSFIRLSNRFN